MFATNYESQWWRFSSPPKKTTLEMVAEFHSTFSKDPDPTTPTVTNKEINKLRIDLLQEELNELKEALDKEDTVETLDALTDLQYVLDGAYLSFGLGGHKEAAFDEVHSSNMSKLGEDGKPIYREDNKVMKGPNYFRPDLGKILNV